MDLALIFIALKNGLKEYVTSLPQRELDDSWEFRGHQGVYIFQDDQGPVRVGQGKNVGARLSSQKHWIGHWMARERALDLGMETGEVAFEDVEEFLRLRGIPVPLHITFRFISLEDIDKGGMTLSGMEGLIQWAFKPKLNVPREISALMDVVKWEAIGEVRQFNRSLEWIREGVLSGRLPISEL